MIPKVREFNLWHLMPELIVRGLITFRDYLSTCKYCDLRHDTDSNYAILEVKSGNIARKCFNNYHHILQRYGASQRQQGVLISQLLTFIAAADKIQLPLVIFLNKKEVFVLDRIKIALQHLLPKRWLTELAGWGAELRGGWLTRLVIMLFVRYYKVDMQEAQQPNVAVYSTFNAFFVRPLRDDARPIDADPAAIVFPADGVISQLGPIKVEQIFQAKGRYYSLETLLAGNEAMIAHFRNGNFVTTYLAPRDYHRVHMPCNGMLREMLYVPGELFAVNPLTTANIPNLFARNERVICLFDTDFGPMAQILVGATIIGSIETVWAGTVTPPRQGIIKRWHYPLTDIDEAVALLKGQEMGRFKLGSTVINLFASKNVLLDDHLSARYIARVGQRLANGITQTDRPLT